MGKKDNYQTDKAMSGGGRYEILAITLIGYDGERRDIDVRKRHSIIERTCSANPNYERRGTVKDRWLKAYNKAQRLEHDLLKKINVRSRDVLWTDIKFKLKYYG